MDRLRKGLFHNPFRRQKESLDVQTQTNLMKIPKDGTTNVLLPASSSQFTTQSTQSTKPFRPIDLWQVAYGQLNKEERRILSKIQDTANLIGNQSQTKVLIGEVIRLTEEQYEKYQQKANGKLRESCQKIINAALSFKDIINAVAASDPTNHAVRAWTIVSFGLTIRKAQVPSMGRKLLDCVTVITEHLLTELKASVEAERKILRRWIELDEYLHHEEEAENILHRIDELAESMKQLIEQFNLVNLRVAEEAFYNSYVSQDEDFCLPNNRTDLRRQILEWTESSDSKFAQSCEQLGATFFFKKGEADRSDAKYLISTITKQLVNRYRRLAPVVLEVIKKDPDISAKSLGEQFNKLLLQPLQNLKLNQSTTTVIVIDALDECEREGDIQVILELLPLLQKSRSIRLRIFLTSRPELPIRLGFRKHDDHQDLVLHKLPRPVIEHDIRLFLKDWLSRIRDDDDLLSSTNWPGEDDIEKLVAMSVPLFIFTATLCRVIGDRKQSPQKRLTAVLQSQAATSASQMKSVYEPVLKQILISEDEIESKEFGKEFCSIVGVIILLATPLMVDALGKLLNLAKEDISYLLNKLHSVLSVAQNLDAPVRILHLSFRDFLVNTKSTFHVDEQETHQQIALHCIRVMDTSLKHNIYSLSSYRILRKDIDHQTVNQHLSADLQYSCYYWVQHIQRSKGRISESRSFPFLKSHRLHWLEALSLMDVMSEAVGMIDTLQTSVGDTNVETADFIYDARQFIL
ncbi:hypothetical protein BBP40_005051 [Aspergillus hancockii]|nr:hypothetical protein BBP40_005051 [Aspergillus hancockii]